MKPLDQMTDEELATERAALRAEIVVPRRVVANTVAIYTSIVLANR